MNTSTQISLMLGIAIAVVTACDSSVGSASDKAPPEATVAPGAEIPHPDTFLLVEWKIGAIKYCPQSDPPPGTNMPKAGDTYKIVKDEEKNIYTIENVDGDGMDDWTRLELEYKDRDRKRRPKGHAIIANRKPRCDVGPSYFADRLVGCSEGGDKNHCFHIDFVENSSLHSNKEWSPYITYVEDGQHNGIIH